MAVVVPFRKPPPKRDWPWWTSLALLGAIVLGAAALLSSCGHSMVGKCGDGCTPDPEIEDAVKACFDSPEIGRVCAYSAIGDDCSEFFLRPGCASAWEYKGTRCHYGADHGT